MDHEREKKSVLAVLLSYAGSYRGLTYLGLALSAVAMVLGMLPYICIWLAARDLIAVAPDWTRSAGIERYGWMAQRQRRRRCSLTTSRTLWERRRCFSRRSG